MSKRLVLTIVGRTIIKDSDGDYHREPNKLVVATSNSRALLECEAKRWDGAYNKVIEAAHEIVNIIGGELEDCDPQLQTASECYNEAVNDGISGERVAELFWNGWAVCCDSIYESDDVDDLFLPFEYEITEVVDIRSF